MATNVIMYQARGDTTAPPPVHKAATSQKRTYRKGQSLFALVDKIKLWPSRTGQLHGIRHMERQGSQAVITTHCGKTFTIRDSRTSRAARWLRNKLFAGACPLCRVPDWKLEKYQGTAFRKKFGSVLPVTAQAS